MRCVIEGNGVKVFGKAVHALSRIGDDIWLDPLQKGLALRSVNMAQSAYACFLFSPLFFQLYTPNIKREQSESVKCKVSLKSLLPLFRSVATMERNVHKCEIYIDDCDNKVMFKFNCKHGITKTHNLGYYECEALQAVFPTHLCPNILKAQPKLLSNIVMQFPFSQEEVTLSVSPIRVKLKNYHEEENDHMKCMYTEMSLHPDEFDYFQVGVASDITFCLKELRGLLSFAESHGLPVSVHFGASGKPVSFSVEDLVLEAVVVLATLVSKEWENPSQVSIPQEAPTPRYVSEACAANTFAADTSIADTAICEGPLEGEATGVAHQLSAFLTREQVPSSQGSSVFSPASHMRKCLQLHERVDFLRSEATLCDLSTESNLTATPNTSKIRSLLFGAVSSDQAECNALELPSLVSASDTEDDAGEHCGKLLRPPSNCPLPLSFSPNMVRKTVKLMGPGASFSISSISSCFTFSRPAAPAEFQEFRVAVGLEPTWNHWAQNKNTPWRGCQSNSGQHTLWTLLSRQSTYQFMFLDRGRKLMRTLGEHKKTPHSHPE